MAKIVRKISKDSISWFCSVAVKIPVWDMSQKTSICRKMALLMQPRPKLWNSSRQCNAGVLIILQYLLAVRPYYTCEIAI